MADAQAQETLNSLEDLAKTTVEGVEAAKQADEPVTREPKIDDLGRSYGTGRRKGAVARVWLKKGSGQVTVNGKSQNDYFGRQTHLLVLNQPFLIVDRVGAFDVVCTVKGGGLSGQAGAVRHGISRALENFEPDLRPALKKAGMLTRDARVVDGKRSASTKPAAPNSGRSVSVSKQIKTSKSVWMIQALFFPSFFSVIPSAAEGSDSLSRFKDPSAALGMTMCWGRGG